MENGNNGAVSVKEAAVQLGISPRGVRQRISRGRLRGTQINGEWLVYLTEHTEPPEFVPENNGTGNTDAEHDPFPGTTAQGTRYRRSPIPSPNQQLDAVMSSWLAPLTKTIQEQAEEIGTLRERLATKEREAGALAQALDDISEPEPERQRGFWGRLFG